MNQIRAIVFAALFATTVQGSSLIPTIGMPAGIGYAIDAKGNRQPDVAAVRDAVRAPKPTYPIGRGPGDLGDEWQKTLLGRVGSFRLEIDLNTGKVTKVVAVKSTGVSYLDNLIGSQLHTWAFKPGKWQSLVVATVIRSKWEAIVPR